MLAEMECQFIEVLQRKSKKNFDFRLISVGNSATYEKIDFFVGKDCVIPENLKAGQKVKLTLAIDQNGYKTFISVQGIKA